MGDSIEELERRLERARREAEALKRVRSPSRDLAEAYVRSLERQLAEAIKREHG